MIQDKYDEFFPAEPFGCAGAILVFGSASKAAAINLNRILEGGKGVVFRYIMYRSGGENRLQAVRVLGLGRPIGWTRELTWPAPERFTTTVRAISRDRVRLIAYQGARADHPFTLQLGKSALWRVAP